jgi:hypothetical protein
VKFGKWNRGFGDGMVEESIGKERVARSSSSVVLQDESSFSYEASSRRRVRMVGMSEGIA